MSIGNILSKFQIGRVDMTGTYHEFFSYNNNQQKILYIDTFPYEQFAKDYIARIQILPSSYFNTSDSLAEKILRIIISPKYRNWSLECIHLEKWKEKILEKIQHHIDIKTPIEFMMPAFPFKIQNPLKSNRKDADLAEIVSLLKFYEIHKQIESVYPLGATFHIFHDGHLYYSSFLHSLADADRYLQSLLLFTKELWIDNNVIIHDAKNELDIIFPDRQKEYDIAEKDMKNLWDSDPENERIEKIKEASFNNINLSRYPAYELFRINTLSDVKLSPHEIEDKKQITTLADKCAFEYMTLQHTLERLNFFETCIPYGVRLTVHPKEAHIGVHLVKKKTFLLPRMWVWVIKKDGSMSVRYESEVLGNCDYMKVCIRGEDQPFYYKQI